MIELGFGVKGVRVRFLVLSVEEFSKGPTPLGFRVEGVGCTVYGLGVRLGRPASLSLVYGLMSCLRRFD